MSHISLFFGEGGGGVCVFNLMAILEMLDIDRFSGVGHCRIVINFTNFFRNIDMEVYL